MQTLDGNSSDKISFREMVDEFIEQMQAGFGVEYLVADSATADNLQAIDKLWWISRVPERLTQAQTLIDEQAPKWLLTPTEPASHSLEIEYAGIQSYSRLKPINVRRKRLTDNGKATLNSKPFRNAVNSP